MSYKGLLVQKCNVHRKTTTIGSRGQTDVVWSQVLTNIRCNIQLATYRSELVVIQRGETTVTQYDGYFEYKDDIREGDKIECEDVYYHVNQTAPSVTGRKRVKEAILEIL